MQKQTRNIVITFAVVIIIAGGFIYWGGKKPAGPTNLTGFAQCLKDKGAKFYGTFWCTHCQNQKKMFGTAEKDLPYIECSTPDGQSQTQVCNDAKIESYPTWIFADGSQLVGEIPLETLAEKTSCELPQ